MLQRGAVYSIVGLDASVVVLTKNSWNQRMLSVGAVPIGPRGDTTWALARPLEDDPDQILDPTRLIAVPRARFGRATAVLADESVHGLEQSLSELVDAARLLDEPPRATRPPAGPIDYPRWGEIYHRKGERIAGEAKRYAVVSNDLWNQRNVTVLVARTTTQPKHPTDEFLVVSGGAAQVVCGELTAVPANALDLDRRPPQGQVRLGISDMAAVVRGTTYTHLLRDYLDEFHIEVASVEA